ncbi:conserved hypothetical protein [Gammaproteobacteria bacterium]
MSFHIMQVVSKISLVITALTLDGCIIHPLEPPSIRQMTQLETRQLQTRDYTGAEPINVMKSIIAALQDEGYIISNVNERLGLITAAMERREEDTELKNHVRFMYGAGIGTYQTTKRFEASVTTTEHERVISLRINIIEKALSNSGGVIWSQPVQDTMTYQNIFSKIDKSVFLQKQKL